MANKRAAFVQTCWTFSNSYESMLTWSQKVNLDFHFEIEQRARCGLLAQLRHRPPAGPAPAARSGPGSHAGQRLCKGASSMLWARLSSGYTCSP
jgi:hypothetical protein